MQSLSGNSSRKSVFALCTALGFAVFAASLRAEYKTEADVEDNEVRHFHTVKTGTSQASRKDVPTSGENGDIFVLLGPAKGCTIDADSLSATSSTDTWLGPQDWPRTVADPLPPDDPRSWQWNRFYCEKRVGMAYAYIGHFTGTVSKNPVDTTSNGAGSGHTDTDNRFDVHATGNSGDISIDPSYITLALGETREFTAQTGGGVAVAANWKWGDDNGAGLPDGAQPAAGGTNGIATITAKRHDPGHHALTATDPNDNTRSAVAPVTATGIKSLTVTDANNRDNFITVSTPEDYVLPLGGDPENTDPQTIYIPYTEDENENSTTKINLSAIPHTGAWPAGKPDWTLLDADENIIDELDDPEDPANGDYYPDFDGQAEPTETCTIPNAGKNIFKTDCGNSLEVEAIFCQVQMAKNRVENPDGTRKYIAAKLDQAWPGVSPAESEADISFNITPSEQNEGDYQYQIGILENIAYPEPGEIKDVTWGDSDHEVTYAALEEQKSDLRPLQGPDDILLTFHIAAFQDDGRTLEDLISANEVTTRVYVYSTFEYLVRVKKNYEQAIDFVLWKYSWLDLTSIGGRSDLSYDPDGDPDTYGKAYLVGTKIQLFKSAFDSENICVSVIGHELNHIENAGLLWLGPEEDAYRWEYENAFRTAVEKTWIDGNWDAQEGGPRPDSTYSGYIDND